jgi:hypothetical protein
MSSQDENIMSTLNTVSVPIHPHNKRAMADALDVCARQNRLWPYIPALTASVESWMEVWVRHEVRDGVFICVTILIFAIQNIAVEQAGITFADDAAIDDFFFLHAVDRTTIRAQVRPYATASWIERFPQYVVGLTIRLRDHERVVDSMFANVDVNRLSASAVQVRGALHDAARAFGLMAKNHEITPESLTWHLARLAISRAEVFPPSAPLSVAFGPMRVDPPDSTGRRGGLRGRLALVGLNFYPSILALTLSSPFKPPPARARTSRTQTRSMNTSAESSVRGGGGARRGVRGRGRSRGRGSTRGRGRGQSDGGSPADGSASDSDICLLST